MIRKRYEIVVIGVSSGGMAALPVRSVYSSRMSLGSPRKMKRSASSSPIIMALANPVPEIMPEVARAARPDAIIATGRSDYPNQVNNVLCFPYIFRGALDVRATAINEEMKLACVEAIAALARASTPEDVAQATARRYAQAHGLLIDPARPLRFTPETWL